MKSGTLSNYGLDGPPCERRQIRSGEAIFTPVHAHHPHLVRNEATEDAEFTIVYLNIPPGAKIAMPATGPVECQGLS